MSISSSVTFSIVSAFPGATSSENVIGSNMPRNVLADLLRMATFTMTPTYFSKLYSSIRAIARFNLSAATSLPFKPVLAMLN